MHMINHKILQVARICASSLQAYPFKNQPWQLYGEHIPYTFYKASAKGVAQPGLAEEKQVCLRNQQ